MIVQFHWYLQRWCTWDYCNNIDILHQSNLPCMCILSIYYEILHHSHVEFHKPRDMQITFKLNFSNGIQLPTKYLTYTLLNILNCIRFRKNLSYTLGGLELWVFLPVHHTLCISNGFTPLKMVKP